MDRVAIDLEVRRIHARLVEQNASSWDILDIAMVLMAETIGNLDDTASVKMAAKSARRAITLNERLALTQHTRQTKEKP